MSTVEETFPPVDRLGRRDLRRIPISTLLAALGPGLARRLREVPRRAIVEDGADDDGHFAMVACPCGRQPIVRYSIAKCSGCERFYVAVMPSVFVIYGDMTPPEIPSAATEPDASG